MTKQDFELIARVIRDRNPLTTDRRSLAEAFADELRQTNPRFNRARFIAACVGEDSIDSAGRRVRYSAHA
jgi:hypothetical protein